MISDQWSVRFFRYVTSFLWKEGGAKRWRLTSPTLEIKKSYTLPRPRGRFFISLGRQAGCLVFYAKRYSDSVSPAFRRVVPWRRDRPIGRDGVPRRGTISTCGKMLLPSSNHFPSPRHPERSRRICQRNGKKRGADTKAFERFPRPRRPHESVGMRLLSPSDPSTTLRMTLCWKADEKCFPFAA